MKKIEFYKEVAELLKEVLKDHGLKSDTWFTNAELKSLMSKEQWTRFGDLYLKAYKNYFAKEGYRTSPARLWFNCKADRRMRILQSMSKAGVLENKNGELMYNYPVWKRQNGDYVKVPGKSVYRQLFKVAV